MAVILLAAIFNKQQHEHGFHLFVHVALSALYLFLDDRK